jgi:hypothetical protein
MQWGTFPDWVTAIAAAVTMGAALRGLESWKSQLRAGRDHDIARHILLAAIRLQDAVRIVRISWIDVSEGEPDTADLEADAYKARWALIQEARRDLHFAILEARASWGRSGLEQTELELSRKVNRLRMAVNHKLTRNRPTVFTEEDEAVLWGEEGDEFDQSIGGLVQSYEQALLPKLQRDSMGTLGAVAASDR